jgi:hypothetical protein
VAVQNAQAGVENPKAEEPAGVIEFNVFSAVNRFDKALPELVVNTPCVFAVCELIGR